jgi:hypothetical protein
MSVHSRLYLPGKEFIKESIEGCLEVMDERVKATGSKQMVEVVV